MSAADDDRIVGETDKQQFIAQQSISNQRRHSNDVQIEQPMMMVMITSATQERIVNTSKSNSIDSTRSDTLTNENRLDCSQL